MFFGLHHNHLPNSSDLQAMMMLSNYGATSSFATLPVLNNNDVLNVSMGLGVQNLEAFNQKEESIDINLWVRLNWNDEYLKWDNTTSELTFLSADQEYTWVPDIELLNAASKPEIYTLKGGINLYSDGSIMYSKPGIYKYSCSLNLKRFPFDKQNCTMKFGNWIYSNQHMIGPDGIANIGPGSHRV